MHATMYPLPCQPKRTRFSEHEAFEAINKTYFYYCNNCYFNKYTYFSKTHYIYQKLIFQQDLIHIFAGSVHRRLQFYVQAKYYHKLLV